MDSIISQSYGINHLSYIYIYRYIIYGMRRQNGHINTEYADTKIRPTILCQPPTLIYELLYVREIIGI